MRCAAVLLLVGALAQAGDLADRIWVVRITTERSTFQGTSRRTIAAPALPVDARGLLMAVGFSIDPPDNDQEVVSVSAVRPDGRSVPAQLLGGDDELSCTFFRLLGLKEFPPPVPLEPVALKAGDTVVLLGRHGPLMKFAPRRITAHVDAVAAHPTPLYALKEPLERWLGSIATTPDGRLVGFVDGRPSIVEGTGVMVGVGTQTLVIVSAESFRELARQPPGQEAKSRAWIGVNLAPFDESREAFFGVTDWSGALVTGVAEGSPAAQAGIAVHDLLQSIGDLEIRFEKQEEWNGMLRAVQQLPLNVPLTCRIVRFHRQPDGSYRVERLKIELTLAERPLDFRDAPETEVEDLGLKVKPLTQDWRRTRQVPDSTTGVVITRTAHASATHLAGLRPEDLIVSVDDRPVPTVRALTAVLDDARQKKQGKLVFFVRRGAVTLFVAVTTNW